MNSYKRKSRRHRHHQIFPHFGNIVNEILNAPIAEVLKDSPNVYSRPASNVIETETAFDIEMTLPGFTKEDISIDIDKDIIKISGIKKEDETVEYKLREFNYAKFSRSFRLPESVDQNAISAKFKNGILVITLNKKSIEPAKRIEVE